MKSSVVVAVLAPVLLGACTSLQGIPAGLTPTDKTKLGSQNQERAFEVADRLSETYEKARNDNLRYAYWSNIPLIGLAAAGAGAIAYSAHKDVLAGIGIAAGTLVGFNSFTNSRANAKVYQGGINGLTCVRTKLGAFGALSADPLGLQPATLALQAAETALTTSQSLLNDPRAVKERTDNPAIATAQSANEKLLIQVIGDAKQAIAAGRAEMTALAGLPAYIADSIRQVDAAVANKISQTDVNYSALLSSISGFTSAPKPPADKAAMPKPDSKVIDADKPVAAVVASMQDAMIKLQRATAALVDATSRLGLGARKQEVEACIKAI